MNLRMKRLLVATLGAALAVTGVWFWPGNHLTTGVLAGAQAGEVKDGKDGGKPALTVRVGHPRTVTWPLSIAATGLIAPWQDAVIGAETGGLRIATLEVDVGTQVHAGQILATLASESVNAEMQRLLATQTAARASLAQARSNVERAEIARKGEAISEQQYNDYQIAVQTAQASLAAIEAQIEAQRVVKTHTVILAVDDGVVSSRTATLGKVVQTGEELFRLIRKNRLEWQAEVDAREIGRVRAGQLGRLRLPSGVVLDGRVRLAAPSMASATGRGIVYVSLPASSGVLPGMYANGSIEQATTAALVVPQAAVVVSDGSSYLFEVKPDSHVVRRRVSVGRRQAGEVEILNGIGVEAPIVTDGGAFLGDGDLVLVSRAGTAS
jgi:RND family efflux transporter MFP subunit